MNLNWTDKVNKLEDAPEWMRKAAGMLDTPSDEDIEAAFAKQAHKIVENKVGDLMKDPYRIGFEVVRKNDENTRMTGIFAFRIDKDLVFAVVCFDNGEIKGPILYRCTTSTFVPANKEWAAFLIESMEMGEGRGRDIANRNNSAPLVQMQRLAFMPPGMPKVAANKDRNGADPDKWWDVIDAQMRSEGLHKRLTSKAYAAEFNKRFEDKVKKHGYSIKKAADGSCCECTCHEPKAPTPTTPGEYEISSEVLKVLGGYKGDNKLTVTGGKDVLKMASFGFNSEDFGAELGTLSELWNRAFPEESTLIHDFLAEAEFAKEASAAILEACEKNRDFAERFAAIYPDPSVMFPAMMSSMVKAASAKAELTLIYDTDDMIKSAGTVSPEYFRDGFYILDTRPEETMSVVVEETPDAITQPTAPGKYKVMMADGEFKEAYIAQPYVGKVAPLAGDFFDDDLYDMMGRGDWNRETPIWVVITKDGVVSAGNVLCMEQGDIKDCIREGLLKDSVDANKAYGIVIGNSSQIIGPVYVHAKNTKDGITTLTVDMYRRQNASDWGGMNFFDDEPSGRPRVTLLINPDLSRSNLKTGVFGADARFIELPVEESTSEGSDSRKHKSLKSLDKMLGTMTTFNEWLLGNFGVKNVDVWAEVDREKKAHFTFGDGTGKSASMNKAVALIKLTQDMGLSATDAYGILGHAVEEGHVKFAYHAGDLQKNASRYRVIDRPNLDEEFDSEFGVPMAPVKRFALRVQGDQIMQQPSAIGDAYNPTTMTGLPNITVATTPPEQLEQLAQVYKLPHVFEHGVIGTLSDTYDSLKMIDSWIPKLEDGVDVLGRIQFLMWWKPNDFKQAYGEDDLRNLTAEIESEFESLGGLLLKLLKKSARGKGDSALMQNIGNNDSDEEGENQ